MLCSSVSLKRMQWDADRAALSERATDGSALATRRSAADKGRSTKRFNRAFSMRIAALLLTAAATLTAQNATKPGRFVVEHPTFQNLGFEWTIEGDNNRNAAVEV